MYRSPHLTLAKKYWKELLSHEDIAIDATCGNGHDTLFLTTLGLERILAIDIQSQAIQSTNTLLDKHLSPSEKSKVFFYQMSHSQIDQICFPKKPRLIIYNLGYLPGADKTFTTQTEITLESVQKATTILAPTGALSIMCYPGHEEGAQEEKAILEWAKKLHPNQWRVCHHRFVNKQNAPSLFWIIKYDAILE